MSSALTSRWVTKRIVLPDHPVISAQIWDTAGSERYRCITTGHYRQAVGALLVFDISERESFNNLDYWLTQLRARLYGSKDRSLGIGVVYYF